MVLVINFHSWLLCASARFYIRDLGEAAVIETGKTPTDSRNASEMVNTVSR